MSTISIIKPARVRPEVSRLASGRIPTAHGDFELVYFSNSVDNKEHLAFVKGDVTGADDVLVRVHSECFTGDVMGSLRCDCGEQLQRAMAMIAANGRGVIVYLRQEGRGIGLKAKLEAYNLQDQGYDTVDANLMLGHKADEREYSLAAAILEELKVRSVRLMTNNPLKMGALQADGINVRSRVPVEVPVNPDNHAYLLTKVNRMDHMLVLQRQPAPRQDMHEPELAD